MVRRRFSGGFSLIEMAVVLTITALLVAGGLALVSGRQSIQERSTTNGNLDAITEALRAFIARNYRLPCPAIATLKPGDAGYGEEAASPGTCTGTVFIPAASSTNAEGIVPFKSLGLARELALDGYGRFYTYHVVQAATALTKDTVSSMRGNITLHSALPVGAGFYAAGNLAGNQLNACSAVSSDTNTCNLYGVLALVSHGSDGKGAYDTGGNRPLVPTIGDEPISFANAGALDGDVSFVSPATPPSYYDDLVRVLSPEELLFPLIQKGTMQSARAVTLNRLDTLKKAILSYTAVSGKRLPSSVSAVPWTVADIRLTLRLPENVEKDGWGKDIYYLANPSVTSASMTATTGQANAYVLISTGLDKIYQSTPALSASANDQIQSAASAGDDLIEIITIHELRGAMIYSGLW